MTVIELDPAAEAFGRDTYTYAVPLEVYSGTQGGHILTFIGAAAEITLGLTHTVGSRITRALSSRVRSWFSLIVPGIVPS